VLDAYKKAFWRGEPQPDDTDNGVMIGESRTTLMMARNASPTKDTFVTIAKMFDGTRPIEAFDNTSKIARGLSGQKARGKEYVLFGTRSEDEVAVDLDYLRKGLNVLGRGRIEVRGDGNNKPAFFVNQDGDRFAIAPAILDNMSKWKESIVKFPDILQPSPAPSVT